MSGKIETHHVARRAFVYVRQSTTTQVFENRESTERQYALAERAGALGWSRESIEIVDEDLGRSGKEAEGRSGFGRLAKAVAAGEVGAVFALEVSRLARSSQDWQRLLAVCAVAQVVVCDEHAVYDPREPDDKLLLDFKGTMSEAELHWLSLRLTGARIHKARRGALHFCAPTGYVWSGSGFEKDPDQAVRHAIQLIFDRFAVEPTVGALVRWARATGLLVPTRRSHADGTSELTWKALTRSRLNEILRSPVYAGAYAWGRRPEKRVLVDGEIRTVRPASSPDQWPVLIRDAHEGYISWERYLEDQEKLRENAARHPSRGAPRDGDALLAGILVCGRCGRRMRTTYPAGKDGAWTYICYGEQDRGSRACWLVSGPRIDAAVEELLLRMIIPGELDLTLAVEREVETQARALHEQWKLRLEQTEYEARRAERRYMAVDPDNRVVARTLETDWELRLRELEAVRRAYEEARSAQKVDLCDADRVRIRELAQDLPAVWRACTTKASDRKAMLRIAIESVALQPIDVPERATHVVVQWRSGAVDELRVPRPTSAESNRTPKEAIDRIRELAERGQHDEQIAAQLEAEGQKSGSGNPWTASGVKHARHAHDIPCTAPNRSRKPRLPDRRPDGRYSVPGAARLFGVAETTVHRWVRRGLVRAERADLGRHRRVWWLDLDQETIGRLERKVADRKAKGQRPSVGL